MDLLEATLWRLTGEGLAIKARAAPNYEIHLLPSAAMVLSGEVIMNQIFVPPVAGNEEQLRRFCAIAQARQVRFQVSIHAQSESVFATVIAEKGLQRDRAGRLMVAQPVALRRTTSGYQIARIEREDEWQRVSVILARAFGIPPHADGSYWAMPFGAAASGMGGTILDGPGFSAYLAYDPAGTPVSTVQVHRAGSAAGIWAMATLPEMQRQGAGRAILEHCMTEHVQNGVRLFYLWADESGFPLYEHFGFRTIADVVAYRWSP